jgi:anti-repressor protein
MSSNLQTFINDDFGSIRTVLVDNELWFVSSDICKILGHSNPTVAMDSLEDYEKAKLNLGLRGGKTNVVSESGFYTLVLRSRKEIAKPFRLWVTQEVIPQIRKTGGYIPVSFQDDDLTIMAKAHQILERTIAQKDQLIQQLQPKADTYDMIMNSDGTFSMNQVAKQIGMGEYHLFAYLRGKKILFYEGTDNVPYERFRKNGCFKVVDTISPDGKAHSTTRVTQKGLDYICKIIHKDNEEVA